MNKLTDNDNRVSVKNEWLEARSLLEYIDDDIIPIEKNWCFIFVFMKVIKDQDFKKWPECVLTVVHREATYNLMYIQ